MHPARINAGIAACKAALKAAGTRYELFVYEGVSHAFNNDTSLARYHPEAARRAWERTLRQLKQQLGECAAREAGVLGKSVSKGDGLVGTTGPSVHLLILGPVLDGGL